MKKKKWRLASGCVKQQKNAYIIMKAWADSQQLAVSSGSIARACPRIGAVLGSRNLAHITTTRQHQSQTDGCCSVGGLDTLANRALVKQLARHLALFPNSARRSEGSDHTSISPRQLHSLSLLASFSKYLVAFTVRVLAIVILWWDDKHLSSFNQRVHNFLDRQPQANAFGREWIVPSNYAY